MPQRARRARDPAQKAARRATILDAAGRLFDAEPTAGLAMSRVAREAGLAKGTLYLYFPTKETLFLALLSRELDAWLADLEARLDDLGPTSPDTLADALVDSIVDRRRMLGLLTLLNGVLEHNIDVETAATWKLDLVAHLARTGPRLEATLPGLPPGTGARLLLWLNAVVVGLWPMADPAPAVAEALARPELEPLRLGFRPEARAMLTALLRGLTAP